MGADHDITAAVATTLEAQDRPYQVLGCDPAYADTAAFCARYGFPLEVAANTIVVASRKEPRRFAVCVVLANTRLDVNRRVRKLLGVSKLSFASAADTATVTGMELGGVTPFALPTGLPVYVDHRVMEQEFVILGGGGRTTKIKAPPEVLLEVPGCEVITDLALPPADPPSSA